MWPYICLLITLIACTTAKKSDSGAEVFRQHLADYPDIRKKYIYQSVLRLANIKDDPEFDLLIRNVRKITIYLPPREDSTYQVKSIPSHLGENGYEQLIDVRTADAERVSLWVNESLPKPMYVALLDSGTDDYIMEVDGQINIEYLSSLKFADQGSLRELLK
jgi:hypothetical protein